MSQADSLRQAIQYLQTQNTVLGIDTVQAALAALQEKLDRLTRTVSPQTKHITILMANISGFKQYAETHDAEAVLATMNTIWGALDQIISLYGGQIDKHVGNTVMALWGAQTTHESDPEQAIRAGLAMQSTLHTLSPEIPLQMRIGIHTGLALLGTIASTGEFIALGHAIKLVNLLEEVAKADTVLITHDTYRHVRGIFDTQKHSFLLAVTGRSSSLPIYRVLGVRPRSFYMTPYGIERLETQLIGRDAELQTLQGLIYKIAKTPQFQQIVVVGEAGLGKSRLLHEFLAWVDTHPDLDAWLFRGRASEHFQNTPYALLRDWVTDRFQIKHNDTPEQAREKLKQGVQQFIRVGAEETAQIIGQLIGLGVGNPSPLQALQEEIQLVRNRAFQALADLLRAIHASDDHKPMVLILDDLHWADDGSLQALFYLAQQPDLPLLVIGATRPHLFERYPSEKFVGRLLPLHPLSTEEIEQLVLDILQKMPSPPNELQQVLVRHAEGNPLYLEELIKMLIDEHIIWTGEAHWGVDISRLPELTLPTTLAGVWQTRLDTFPPDLRQIIHLAAVIGRIFWDTAVWDLLRHDQPDLTLEAIQAQLERLEEREFIVRRRESTVRGSREYRFKHILLHDFIYQNQIKQINREWHRRVAEWLLHLGTRTHEHAERIAAHYLQAGSLKLASQYLLQAGQHALQTSAYKEAVHLFQTALKYSSALESPLEQAELGYHLGHARMDLGQYTEAKQDLTNALEIAPLTARIRVNILAALGQIAWWQGNFEEAEQYLATALADAHALQHPTIIPTILQQQGTLARLRGDYPRAQHLGEAALTQFQTLEDERGVVSSLNLLAGVAFFQKDDLKSENLYLQALTLAQQTNDHWHEALILSNLGEVARRNQNYREAQRCFQESQALWQQLGSQTGVSVSWLNRGQVALALGDLTQAEAYFYHALPLFKQMESQSWLANWLVNMSDLRFQQGDSKLALKLLAAIWHQDALSQDARQNAARIRHQLEQSLGTVEVAQRIDYDEPPSFESIIQAFLELATHD